MNKILAACLMAVLCQSTFADNGRWKYINTAQDGSLEVYIDTIRSTPSNVWVKYVYQKKQPDNVTHFIKQDLVDCQNKSMASRQLIFYSKSGKPIYVKQLKIYDPEYQYQEVVPGSLNETIVYYVCPSSYPRPSRTPRDQAVAELNAWGLQMERLEPTEYARLEPALLDYSRRVLGTLPYNQWLPAIQAEYYRLKRQQTAYPQHETPLAPTNRY